MCIAIPGKVITINNDNGIVDFNGVKREIYLFFVPEVEIGDFILVHAGCAIEIIDEEEAQKTIEALKELSMNEIY
ncbi:Hydrogenase isoenzymes formation protein hypC [uncultured Clostridium sp.]|uniref:HypC/HybG/HupF family hydrogenase formation chaperone n=1 Tax=uncultured Clostridium sp. TaxID=59620 RepID=UPI000821BCDA|nr:HypC/HybG/HupF family hydrogenase formation chaperone [uncultured Clostridium sp.]SCJ50809.1 Hydrogenase isoenzymes formation protein hypC [uncultured Clostridium sp.]